MEEYLVRLLDGKYYVIHIDSGCSLPYHSKRIRYLERDFPKWKKGYFTNWFKLSNTERKRIKDKWCPKTFTKASVEELRYDFIYVGKPMIRMQEPYCYGPFDCYQLDDFVDDPLSFADNKPAAVNCPCIKKEGKIPMRNFDTTATAIISNAKSDVSTSRDYFSERLYDALADKRGELYKFFNLEVNNTPKNYQELIAAITGGKYTIDKEIEAQIAAGKMFYNPLNGIIWDGPKADWDGYNIAAREMEVQRALTKDLIYSASDASGMNAALIAFRSWQPTNAPAT